MESDSEERKGPKVTSDSLSSLIWAWVGKTAVALAVLYYGTQLLKGILVARPNLIAYCTTTLGRLDAPLEADYKRYRDDLRKYIQDARTEFAPEALASVIGTTGRTDTRSPETAIKVSKHVLSRLEDVEKKMFRTGVEIVSKFSYRPFFSPTESTSWRLNVCRIVNAGDEPARDVRLEFPLAPRFISTVGHKQGVVDHANVGKSVTLGVLGSGKSVEIRIWDAEPFELLHASGTGEVALGKTVFGWRAWLGERTGKDALLAALVLLVGALVAYGGDRRLHIWRKITTAVTKALARSRSRSTP